jgi:hypothetical protein
MMFCWCVQSQAACFQRPEHSFWLITRYWFTEANGRMCVPVSTASSFQHPFVQHINGTQFAMG